MKIDEWPTLGEMIESGKRVVVFMDSKADVDSVDFILPEFQMVCQCFLVAPHPTQGDVRFGRPLSPSRIRPSHAAWIE